MKKENQTRREFMKRGVQAGVSMGAIASGLSAVSYARVLGANDKIRIGIIGTGGRGRWHIGWVHRASETENAEVMAVCNIWNLQLDLAVDVVKERFSIDPKKYKDYRKLLEDDEIDGVIIATPDHQHCGQLSDSVRAGKDVYVEKPIASTLEELNEAHDVVKASKSVVQHGTQGRSSIGAAATKAFIQTGKLGKLLRVEESRSAYNPYWNYYALPEKEEDTDWKAFLYNRPVRPFNPDQHGSWMGYAEFSPCTIGGWMSHLCDFIHYVTDCGFPVSAVAQGGIYSPTSVKGRTCPDTVTALLEYREGFTISFTTHFGNGANNYTTLFGTKGTMQIQEPDGNRTGGIAPKVSGEGGEEPEKFAESIDIEETPQDNHMVNWLKCMRSREQPHADMDAGYKQGIAVLVPWQAYLEGRKMTFDPRRREIRRV
ncbi:MAG: Gfo/Idh/MocA family oxidoreductase [bacterium]